MPLSAASQVRSVPPPCLEGLWGLEEGPWWPFPETQTQGSVGTRGQNMREDSGRQHIKGGGEEKGVPVCLKGQGCSECGSRVALLGSVCLGMDLRESS